MMQTEYGTGLVKYERNLNSGAKRRSKTTDSIGTGSMCTTDDGVDDSGDECDGQVDMDCPRQTKRSKITADDCHDLIFEKAVGASWPLKLVKTHLPDVKVPRRKVFLDADGIKSIVLPSTAWKGQLPDGCSRVLQRRKQTVRKTTNALKSKDCVRRGQFNSMWKLAKASVPVSRQGGARSALILKASP